MKEDVRRILKVAAPFAGVALGWYLFMPNFEVLLFGGGKYRSQVVLDAQRLSRWYEDTFNPRKEKLWLTCYGKVTTEWLSIPSTDPRWGKVSVKEMVEKKCGPEPAGLRSNRD